MDKCDHTFLMGNSALCPTWKPKIYYCYFCKQEGTLDEFEAEKRKKIEKANRLTPEEGYMHIED